MEVDALSCVSSSSLGSGSVKGYVYVTVTPTPIPTLTLSLTPTLIPYPYPHPHTDCSVERGFVRYSCRTILTLSLIPNPFLCGYPGAYSPTCDATR